MSRGRVAVVGGSVAGCATALAVRRSGAAEVTVFERAAGGLRDRGVGIGVRSALARELESAGYLSPATPYVRLARRRWITSDGASRGGRVVGSQPFDFRAYDWGSVWGALRDAVPGEVGYRAGCQVVSVADDGDAGDGVVVALADGTRERFDAVLGADGYRSVVRAGMFPAVRPDYAGYLLWRGTVAAADLPGRAGLWEADESVTVAFPGGHLMMYLIPGRLGAPVLNWAVYAVPPPDLAPDGDDPTSMPPGAVGAGLLDHLEVRAERLPPYWRELLQRTPPETLLVQPIYDVCAPACAVGRRALVGDAAAVARPHTGGGAVKALQDAVTLQSVLSEGRGWPEALDAYDRQRTPVNRSMVALGRTLGAATVSAAPDWRTMDPPRFTAWWADVTGQRPIGGVGLTT